MPSAFVERRPTCQELIRAHSYPVADCVALDISGLHPVSTEFSGATPVDQDLAPCSCFSSVTQLVCYFPSFFYYTQKTECNFYFVSS